MWLLMAGDECNAVVTATTEVLFFFLSVGSKICEATVISSNTPDEERTNDCIAPSSFFGIQVVGATNAVPAA